MVFDCREREMAYYCIACAQNCRQTDYLGSGQFGTVYKGTWKSSSDVKSTDIAIKILKNGADEKEMLRFLQEGAINGQFHHPNVVKLLGMVTIGEPVSDDDITKLKVYLPPLA